MNATWQLNPARDICRDDSGALVVDGGAQRVRLPAPASRGLIAIVLALDSRGGAATVADLVATTDLAESDLERGLDLLCSMDAVVSADQLARWPGLEWAVHRAGAASRVELTGEPTATAPLPDVVVDGPASWAVPMARALRRQGLEAHHDVLGVVGAVTVHRYGSPRHASATHSLRAGTTVAGPAVGPWSYDSAVDLCDECVCASTPALAGPDTDDHDLLAALVAAEYLRTRSTSASLGPRRVRLFDLANLETVELPAPRRLGCARCGTVGRFARSFEQGHLLDQLAGPARTQPQEPSVLTDVDQAAADDLVGTEALGTPDASAAVPTGVHEVVRGAFGRVVGTEDAPRFVNPTAGNLRSVKAYVCGADGLRLFDHISDDFHLAARPRHPVDASDTVLLTGERSRLTRKYGLLGERLLALDAGAAIAVLAVSAAARGRRAIVTPLPTEPARGSGLHLDQDVPAALVRLDVDGAAAASPLGVLADALPTRRARREYSADALDAAALDAAIGRASAAFERLWDAAEIPTPTLELVTFRHPDPAPSRAAQVPTAGLPHLRHWMQQDLTGCAAVGLVGLPVTPLTRRFAANAHTVGLQLSACWLTLLWLALESTSVAMAPYGPSLDWLRIADDDSYAFASAVLGTHRSRT